VEQYRRLWEDRLDRLDAYLAELQATPAAGEAPATASPPAAAASPAEPGRKTRSGQPAAPKRRPRKSP
jgi:hypothetical protein